MAAETKAIRSKKPDKRGVIIVGLLLFFLIAFLHSNFQSGNGPSESNNQTAAPNSTISEPSVPNGNNSNPETSTNEPAGGQNQPSGSETTGTISIISDPSGAAVFVDTVAYGSTPLTVNLSVGNYILSLTKPGYQTYKAQILINASQVAYLNASMIQTIPSNTPPNDTAQTGMLSIHSSPAKATIYIDGATVGENNQTPAVYSNITADYHMISFEKPGYVPYSIKVYVAAGIANLVEANLTAIDAQFGALNITTSPEAAEFYLDNQLAGTTPIVYNATVGYHFVRLEKAGFISYNKRFYTNANKVINIDVALEAINNTQ